MPSSDDANRLKSDMRMDWCPVSFYVGPHDIGTLPTTIAQYWHWVNEPSQRKTATGVYSWTLETYLYLKELGLPCTLTSELLTDGIIVTHRDLLPVGLRPGIGTLIVCAKAERGAHPYAQINIVQNPDDPVADPMKSLWLSQGVAHIESWVQPELISRNSVRGNRFENIALYGFNIASELLDPHWHKQLADLGFKVIVVNDKNREKMNDFSNADVYVNVRSFQPQIAHAMKPAHKLFNAWIAGVPAILGNEPGFRRERESVYDYIQVDSQQAIVDALLKLRSDVDFRRKMLENGKNRSSKYLPQSMAEQWVEFLRTVAIPKYHRWRNLPKISRQWYFLTRRASFYYYLRAAF